MKRKANRQVKIIWHTESLEGCFNLLLALSLTFESHSGQARRGCRLGHRSSWCSATLSVAWTRVVDLSPTSRSVRAGSLDREGSWCSFLSCCTVSQGEIVSESQEQGLIFVKDFTLEKLSWNVLANNMLTLRELLYWITDFVLKLHTNKKSQTRSSNAMKVFKYKQIIVAFRGCVDCLNRLKHSLLKVTYQPVKPISTNPINIIIKKTRITRMLP